MAYSGGPASSAVVPLTMQAPPDVEPGVTGNFAGLARAASDPSMKVHTGKIHPTSVWNAVAEKKHMAVDLDELSDPETEDGDGCAGELPCYSHLARLLGEEAPGADAGARPGDKAAAHARRGRGHRARRASGHKPLAVAPVRRDPLLGARLAAEAQLFSSLLGGLGCRRPGSQPRVLCVSRRHCRKNKYVDIVGEFHLDLVQDFGGVPIILPRTNLTLQGLLEFFPMDGLLVAEGNDLSDEILNKYHCRLPARLEGEAAAKYASDTEFDVSKDELEFALMHFALASGCPILSMCRGSQMLNVLRGGSLIGDIGTEVGDQVVHLRDGSDPTYDSFRHPISVVPDTPLAGWFADSLQGSDELLVNSYHHQAVKELGPGFKEMARAPDGVLEAFYDPSYDPAKGKFVVGLQFHPERMLDDYPGCSRVYESFLQACSAFKGARDAAVLAGRR